LWGKVVGEVGIRKGHCTESVKKQSSRWLDRIIRLDADEDAEGLLGRLGPPDSSHPLGELKLRPSSLPDRPRF